MVEVTVFKEGKLYTAIRNRDGTETLVEKKYSATAPNTVYADDIKQWVDKTLCIAVRGGKHYLLHPGRGKYSFFIEEKDLYYYAHIYNTKSKEVVTSFCFHNKPSPEDIRSAVFQNSVHISRARSFIGDEPFVVAFKHRMLSESAWRAVYKSNHGTAKCVDKQLDSYHAILKDLDPDFVRGETVADAIEKAKQQIKLNRETMLCIDSSDATDVYPIRDVYGIWTNCSLELGILSGTNDFVRRMPDSINMSVFKSAADILRAPL